MTVPNTFATKTGTILLSELDENFATPITIGTTSVALGSTATSIAGLNNLAYTGTLTGGTGVVAIGTNQIYKDASGNVGIGTSSPSRKLDILGTANSGVSIKVSATNSGSSTFSALIFGSNIDAAVSYIQQNSSTNTTLGGGNSLNILSKSGPMVFSTNNIENMRIDSGNVGIGLTSPTGKLDVAGTIKTLGYTVATLPTGVVGARAYVTDALAPTFGATVVTGGAVTIPVFYNGTNWIVG